MTHMNYQRRTRVINSFSTHFKQVNKPMEPNFKKMLSLRLGDDISKARWSSVLKSRCSARPLLVSITCYLIAPLPSRPCSLIVQPNVNISTATQPVQLLRHWELISSHVGHQQEGHLLRAGAEAAHVGGRQTLQFSQ